MRMVRNLTRFNNSYIKSAYCSSCDDYGVNADEISLNGDSFYAEVYDSFDDGGKAVQMSPPDKLTRWIITHSKGFTRKSIGKVGRYVRAYVYLVLTSQVQVRSSIVGNSVSPVDAQQVLKSTFLCFLKWFQYHSC